MSEQERPALLLAEALDLCEALAQYFGDVRLSHAAERLIDIRDLLRSQAYLLKLTAFLLRQQPRNERKLEELIRACQDETQPLPGGPEAAAEVPVPDKPVPGPTPNPDSGSARH